MKYKILSLNYAKKQRKDEHSSPDNESESSKEDNYLHYFFELEKNIQEKTNIFFNDFESKDTSIQNLNSFLNFLNYHHLSIDIKDPSGKTLLHHASFNGNNEAVKLLIKKGASTAIRDSTFNFNVIDWARAGTITQFMLLDDKIKTNNNFIEVFEEFKHVPGIKDIQLLQTRILWKKKWAIKYKYQTIEKISSIQRLDDMEWKLIHSSLFNPFNKLNIFTDIYYDKDLIVIKNILINHQQKLFKNTLSSSIPNNFW